MRKTPEFCVKTLSETPVSLSQDDSTQSILVKSLFNEEFLGHTRGWVTVYSAVKLASLWGLEYGPELKAQDGLLSETVSKIIPGQAIIGWSTSCSASSPSSRPRPGRCSSSL